MGKGIVSKGKGFTLKKSSLGKASKSQKVSNKHRKVNKPLLVSKVKRNLEKISVIERARASQKVPTGSAQIVLQESALQIFSNKVSCPVSNFDEKYVNSLAPNQYPVKRKKPTINPTLNRYSGLNFDSDSDSETQPGITLKSSVLQNVEFDDDL